MKRELFLSLIILIILSSFSCSFVSQEELFSNRPQQKADITLNNSHYLFSQNDSEALLIEAEKIELYNTAKKAYITNGTFSQHDEDGTLLFSGSFGFAIADTKTNDLILSNHLLIINHKDKFSIEAEEVAWTDELQYLQSSEQSIVTVINKEHDIMRGRGFFGNFKTATFEFQTMDQGVMHYE